MNDSLGDRMKAYEAVETERRFIPMLPVYARIDGRGFSSFTRGMARPFDPGMTQAMIATTAHLVEHTHARIGYTQSDEISLVWLMDDPKSDLLFDGKIQKMTSVLASMTTAAFTRAIMPEYVDRLPHFDARVFQFPNRVEATNVFLWRELDATKNAISMAARTIASHKSLHGKSSSEKQEMLFAAGINFNDYPSSFKRGTFLRRVTEERTLTDSERAAIPELHRPSAAQTFLRSSVRVLDMPRFGSVTNREAVIFDGAIPALD